jgi:hypothetical protein
MSIARRIIAIVGIAGVLTASALAGVRVAFAGQSATGAVTKSSSGSSSEFTPDHGSTQDPGPVPALRAGELPVAKGGPGEASISSGGTRDVRELASSEPVETDAPEQTPTYDFSMDAAAISYPDWLEGSELEDAKTWVRQRIAVAKCMEQKGFEYSFKLWWERSDDDLVPRAFYPIGSPGFEALYGEGGDQPYEWTNAGCDGVAVHDLGLDDAR